MIDFFDHHPVLLCTRIPLVALQATEGQWRSSLEDF